MIDDVFGLVLTIGGMILIIGGMLLIVGMVVVFPRLLEKIIDKVQNL